MELIDTIKTRQSIRGYKQTPVPNEILMDILDIARLSPSAINWQPWEFIVLTGESLEQARTTNVEQASSRAQIAPDFPIYRPKGPYAVRNSALAQNLFTLMNIDRADSKKREAWKLKGKRFFDAPAAILVCLDEAVYNEHEHVSLLDIGIVTHCITLLALGYGLGTCITQDALFYPDALRETLGIPTTKRLIVAIAIGYPDWTFPANQLRTERETVESLVTWKH